jgi:DNA-binding CsgD family transcriptional regulator
MAFPLHAGNLDSVYIALDAAIKDQAKYDALREQKISQLRRQLRLAKGNYVSTYTLNDHLYTAFKAYRYDSTANYLKKNIALARQHNDKSRMYASQLKLAYLFASSGMYLEAVDLLKTIDSRKLTGNLKIDYYNTCFHTYGEQGHYSPDQESNNYYSHLGDMYHDSLLSILPHQSMLYYSIRETDARNNHQFQEALKYNSLQMATLEKGSPDYSIVCFFRSQDYLDRGDIANEKYWLALSAISDVKQAVHDQAALWMLADRLVQEGDVERSYRYIRFSWDGVHYYNTPLRHMQTSGVLSMVDRNYQVLMEKQNSRLRIYLLLISALSLLLIVAVGYVYVQMKHLAEARNSLHIANGHLTELNDKLQEMIGSLNKSNVQLKDSNKIKEVYIGRFLSLCSLYMDKLDVFRNTVIKKSKTGQLPEYLSNSKIQSLKDKDLVDLLRNFDYAFLCIVPNFIEEFNNLLKPEARIFPEKDELLNTELRIFALIRLGIEDSSKIAEFLHYSVNTIYNYRAKVKSTAIVSRDEFEKMVKEIDR